MPKHAGDAHHTGEKRLKGFGWLPNKMRVPLIIFLGEFIGTFLFLFFAFAATQTANNLLGSRSMNIESLLYISLAFGSSLAVNVWVFFRISGGLFNPAVGHLSQAFHSTCPRAGGSPSPTYLRL